MVAEYTRRFYNPAAAKWRFLTAEAGARARAFSSWKSNVREAWAEFAVKDVIMEVHNGDGNKKLNPKQPELKVGSELSVRALVKLGKASPNDVSVELYYGPVDNWENIRDGSSVRMEYERAAEEGGDHWFAGSMPCRKTGQHGVAVRVLPRHSDLANPYEMGLILWETAK
jgi:starch phosphorylase